VSAGVRRVAMLALAALTAACGPESNSSAPSAATSPAPSSTKNWNVLLISFDTTRADALGCYGNALGATPEVDAFARESVVFDHAFSPVPLTLPAHTTMLTGLDPNRHSVRDNTIYDVPLAAQTLPELLKLEGRRTFAVVASVVLLARHQLNQGFDDYDDRGLQVTLGDEHMRKAETIAAAATTQLAGREPFFGFVHFYDAHQPWKPPADLAAKFPDAYMASVASEDRAFGKLLRSLRESGRLARTVVILTADHGEGRGEHGETTHGLLLHGATAHVPLVIRVPGAPAGRCDALVRLCDLLPTVAGLLGVAPPADLDGVSLAPALEASTHEQDDADVYLETLAPQLSYDFAPLFGVRTREWELVLAGRPHLWHVSEDPGEQKDVAADHADVVASLTRRLDHLRHGRGPALDRDTRAIDPDELKVLGGLGYVSRGSDDDAANATGGPDVYDHIAATDDLGRAWLLVEARRFDEAIALYSQLLATLPGCYPAQNGLGLAYARKGDHEHALENLLKAAAIHGGSPGVHMNIALSAHFLKKSDLVRQHLEAAIALPNCPARAWFMLSEERRDAGDRAGAKAILEQLLAKPGFSADDRKQAEALLKEFQ